MNILARPRRWSAGLVRRLRDYVREKPWLFRTAAAVRFTLLAGPWRPLLVRYYQRTARNPLLATAAHTVFEGFDPAAAARDLERDGIALGLRLPAECADRLAEFFGPLARGTRIDIHEDCPTAHAIAHDPALVEAARRYLGAEPVLFATHLWCTPPETAPRHAHRFHFDVSDVRAVTAFFYLTDVDEACGPHVVVGGTHRRKRLAELARIYQPDAAVQRRHGDRVRVITGPRGTGFLEEQTALHKALMARKHRLVFSVCYTLHRKPAPAPHDR